MNVIDSHNLRGAQNDLFIPKSGKYEDPSEDFSLKGRGYTEQANQLIFVNGHICIEQANLNFQRVLFLGWPNRPSSGVMENLHCKLLYLENFESLFRKLHIKLNLKTII